jgi:hypothetical protein
MELGLAQHGAQTHLLSQNSVGSIGSYSFYQQPRILLVLGGTMLVVAWALDGVAYFVTNHSQSHLTLFGFLLLCGALLQTIGALIIAASDIDIDLFAKRHPVCVFSFAFSWIALYNGFLALTPPIQWISQIQWVASFPFAYLLFRFRAVRQMCSKSNPRVSDLFAYSLSLDLASSGIYFFVWANFYPSPFFFKWHYNLVGSLYFLSGVFLFLFYWHLRSKHSRRLALSNILYAYLLLIGVCSLTDNLCKKYASANDRLLPWIDFSFAIIHITFPLAYFALRPIIYPCIGRRWLKQRITNVDSIAEEQGIAPDHGNLTSVQGLMTTGSDLNTHIDHKHNAADEFTVLILACFNRHEDAVDLLLRQDDVQVNKVSRLHS